MLCWNETHRGATSLAVVAVAISIVGCGDDLYEPRHVNSVSEAVSFHLSDDAIIPYDLMKERLRPDFKLGTGKDGKTMSQGDGALAKVLPTTGYYEQQVIQALSAALAIRLPTTTTSDETKTTTKDGKTEVTVNNTTTYASGTVPTVDDLKKGQPGANPQAMNKIEALKTDDDKRKLDQSNPLLQYNLAAALVQEVAMLNTAIDHLESVNRATYNTYLLRLRVAMQPLAPNQPYNAYVALAFFCQAAKKVTADTSGVDFDGRPKEGEGFVKVHPLLVIDDLESTSTARSAQLITQLSLAISGMIGPTGFGGLFSSDRSKIRTLLGKDLNSTFSISRTADNAVSVRLGAPRQPTAGYAMVNRNHAVSVVLQTPKGEECKFVDVTFAGSLRDADTGKIVPDPLQPVIDGAKAALHRFLESYATDKQKLDTAIKQLPVGTIRQLTGPITGSDYSAFYDNLGRALDEPALRQAIPHENRDTILDAWRTLWGKLAETKSLSPYQHVRIVLPEPAAPSRAGSTFVPVRRPVASTPGQGSVVPQVTKDAKKY